jgi:hypothetical protein
MREDNPFHSGDFSLKKNSPMKGISEELSRFLHDPPNLEFVFLRNN